MGKSGPDRDQSIRKRIISSSAGYVFFRTIAGGLGAAATLLLYRLLGPDEAGRFAVAMALATTFGSLTGLGFTGTLARFVPEGGPDEGAGLYRRALRFVFIALFFGALLFVVFSWLGFGVPAEIRSIVPIVIVAMAAYTLYTTAQGMMQGQGRFRLLPRLEFGANFMAKIAALGVILIIPGYVAAFTARTVVQVLIVGLTFYILKGALSKPERRLKSHEAEFTRLVWFGAVILMLSNTVSLYVIRFMLEPADVGIFAAGSRFTVIIEQLVIASINVPLLFYFSHPESSSMKYAIVQKGTRVAGSLMGLAALFLAITAEWIVRLLLGEAYDESASVARIYASHALGAALLIFFVPLSTSENKPQYVITLNFTNFLITLILALILVPSYGAIGAAIAGVVAIQVVVIGATVFLKHRFGVDVRGIVFRILALYSGCYVLLEWGQPLLACLVYIAALWPLKLLRPGDYDLIKRGRAGG